MPNHLHRGGAAKVLTLILGGRHISVPVPVKIPFYNLHSVIYLKDNFETNLI